MSRCEAKFIVFDVALGQAIGVETGLDDRWLQVIAEDAGEIRGPDDVGGVAVDDRLLVRFDCARLRASR